MNKLLHPFIIIAFVLFVIPVQISALTCAEPIPSIGKIVEIENIENGKNLKIDEINTFAYDWSSAKLYELDKYDDLVNDYVSGENKLSKEFAREGFEWINTISINDKALDIYEPKIGDVVIQGPPTHVCSLAFIGVFNAESKLQVALIKDGFQNYSFGSDKLVVESGDDISCDKTGHCSVEVIFRLNENYFTLSPGDAYINRGKGAIRSITLIESSDLLESSDGTVLFDWGFGTYAHYALGFIESTTTQPPSMPKKPGIITLDTNSKQDTKSNIFLKFWSWIKSWF